MKRLSFLRTITQHLSKWQRNNQLEIELDEIVLESTQLVSLAMVGFFTILTILHLLILPPDIGAIMAPVAMMSGLAVGAIGLAIRGNKIRTEYTYLIAFTVFFIGLTNCAIHLYITADFDQSSNFSLIFVAVGLFFLSLRYLVVAYAITFFVWIALAIGMEDPETEFAHFAILNVQAMVIGYISHFLRLRVNRRLIKLRSEALVRESELAKALDTSRLYAAAERENKAKTEFLANMSHELRTPLNAILGFSEIMKEQSFGPHAVKKYREYSEDIHTAGDHLLSLVNDILDLSRIELHEQEFSIEPVDITRTCENCITIVRQHAERGQIKLTYDAPESLPQLQTDKRRLKQILTNLLSNAVKFTPPDGRIHLGVSVTQDDHMLFRVSDTGIGMSAEELAQATKPFWQADAGLDRTYEGTGLGLALVTEMLKMMKGDLVLESEPMKGTVATVRLPLALPVVMSGSRAAE